MAAYHLKLFDIASPYGYWDSFPNRPDRYNVFFACKSKKSKLAFETSRIIADVKCEKCLMVYDYMLGEGLIKVTTNGNINFVKCKNKPKLMKSIYKKFNLNENLQKVQNKQAT